MAIVFAPSDSPGRAVPRDSSRSKLGLLAAGAQGKVGPSLALRPRFGISLRCCGLEGQMILVPRLRQQSANALAPN